MAKFRKKPVVIEAVHWLGLIECLQEIARLDTDKKTKVVDGGAAIEIETLEGTMTAMIGDWIIRDVKGELYPCKPDIFEATYDAEPETESQDAETA
jgi:hypothetical protein